MRCILWAIFQPPGGTQSSAVLICAGFWSCSWTRFLIKTQYEPQLEGSGWAKKASKALKPRAVAVSPLSLLFQIGHTETSGDCPGALTSHNSFSRSFFLKESFLKIWDCDMGISWRVASLLLCWASGWENRYNEGISSSQEDCALLLFVSYWFWGLVKGSRNTSVSHI